MAAAMPYTAVNAQSSADPHDAVVPMEAIRVEASADASADGLAQPYAGGQVARGFGNFQESYFIRGFILGSDDVAYNGLYSLLPR